MADFKVDIEVLQKTKQTYNESVTNINNIKNNLTTLVQQLKETGWNSDAGKKFFESYDEGWAKNIDKYTKFVEFMSELLVQAEASYQEVIDASEELKF